MFTEQAFGMLAVNVQTLGLPVRNVGASDVWAFIPIQSKPLEICDQLIFIPRFAAIYIGVFNPHDHHPALLAGKQPVEEGSAGVSYVKLASGRWRETHPNA